ncbi:GNAT family N-acetyltransferase [Marinomonas sp. TW1]|uniref:GNAT family N-acetyltransferase n=1 Tax=Marinomonas sp. TW1 TaxID=1561203 RepID=UPI0009EEF87A|nr:GNAT family N-acetyltransferase [Marinomonas sp. TW1]
MSVFSSTGNQKYFAVVLSVKLMLEDLTHRIMIEKLLMMAKDKPDYLGEETSFGEIYTLITYWQTEAAAQEWQEDEMLRRVLSLGEHFWYQEYSIKSCVVTKDMSFKTANADLHTSRFPIIKTPRGVLRILEESQAELLHDYVNSERHFLAPWEPLRNEAYYSLETCQLRVREMRRDFLEDKGCVLCLLTPDETKMLAYSNYSNIVRGVFQACTLGYSLRESEQGKGLMNEMLTSGIRYMQKEQQIDRIQAGYMPRNERSAAVLAKLGFEKEGMARDYLKINGQWEDHVLMALILR